MVDISVVIVSWNARSFLMECLNSLTNTTSNHTIEVIVVDNGSNDGSQELVKELFPWVRLIENDSNLGFAKANNIGIKQSSGRYIALINSDVKVLDKCLDRLCDYFDKNPEAGILGPKILNPDMSIQWSCRKYPSIWRLLCSALWLNRFFSRIDFFNGEELTSISYNCTRKVDALSGCFLLVRRKAVDEVGLLDENYFIYSEDIDWCRRFFKAGWEVVFYPGGEAIHYKSGSSSNSPAVFSVEKDKALFQYGKKYFSTFSIMALWVTLLLHHGIRILLELFIMITKYYDRKQRVMKLKGHLLCFKWLLEYPMQTLM